MAQRLRPGCFDDHRTLRPLRPELPQQPLRSAFGWLLLRHARTVVCQPLDVREPASLHSVAATRVLLGSAFVLQSGSPTPTETSTASVSSSASITGSPTATETASEVSYGREICRALGCAGRPVVAGTGLPVRARVERETTGSFTTCAARVDSARGVGLLGSGHIVLLICS
jgi:hypothetical protein